MTTLRKIATETEAMLINEMAKDIQFDTDLGDEAEVARDLSSKRWSAEMIYDYLDPVIERARVIKATEAVASGGAGLFAAVSWAAFSWFVLWPDNAMAATLSGSDWPSVAWRAFLTVFGWLAVIAILIGVASLARLMKRPQPDDTWKPPVGPGNVERRAREAGQ